MTGYLQEHISHQEPAVQRHHAPNSDVFHSEGAPVASARQGEAQPPCLWLREL